MDVKKISFWIGKVSSIDEPLIVIRTDDQFEVMSDAIWDCFEINGDKYYGSIAYRGWKAFFDYHERMNYTL